MGDTCRKEKEKEDRRVVVGMGRYVVARGQSGNIISRWEEVLCEMEKRKAVNKYNLSTPYSFLYYFYLFKTTIYSTLNIISLIFFLKRKIKKQ